MYERYVLNSKNAKSKNDAVRSRGFRHWSDPLPARSRGSPMPETPGSHGIGCSSLSRNDVRSRGFRHSAPQSLFVRVSNDDRTNANEPVVWLVPAGWNEPRRPAASAERRRAKNYVNRCAGAPHCTRAAGSLLATVEGVSYFLSIFLFYGSYNRVVLCVFTLCFPLCFYLRRDRVKT